MMLRCRIGAVLATLMLLLSSDSNAETRKWTDASGKFEVQAELVDLVDNVVQIKRLDGKTVSIPLNLLSKTDRDYVKQHSSDKKRPKSTGSMAQAGPAVIELLSGSKVNAKITARDPQYVACTIRVSNRNIERKYPINKIHAITIAGRREVLNESNTRKLKGASHLRTRSEVESVIEEMGRMPPDWWDSAKFNHPQTLDLSWPLKGPKQWNSQRNVGQYLWDTINPNPSKWHAGTRLVHEMLNRHANDQAKLQRDIQTLGRMYFDLLQDYPRAAFWWQKAGLNRGNPTPQSVKLAECYFRLGNKKMALDLIGRPPYYFTTIKLLADMGETNHALRLAESAAQGNAPELAYLAAGDACRVVGKYKQAIDYYERVLRVAASGRFKDRTLRNHQRARANIEGIKIFDALDLGRIPDGTYKSASRGYVADVQVQVQVHGGRIVSVKVTGHKEKQFYSSVTETPRKIVEQQGVKGVDAVTGATITSEAIVNATAKALASGML